MSRRRREFFFFFLGGGRMLNKSKCYDPNRSNFQWKERTYSPFHCFIDPGIAYIVHNSMSDLVNNQWSICFHCYGMKENDVFCDVIKASFPGSCAWYNWSQMKIGEPNVTSFLLRLNVYCLSMKTANIGSVVWLRNDNFTWMIYSSPCYGKISRN